MIALKEMRKHFRVRFAEWVVGLGLFGWGWALMAAPAAVLASPIYVAMERLADINVWGITAILIASIRLVFLIINGTWRKSAHLRALGSGLSAVMFSAMLGSYLTTGMIIPNIFIILPLLAADIYSLWFATEDAASSDKQRDNLKKSKISV